MKAQTLPQLLQERAALSPNQLAFQTAQENISWQEFSKQVTGLALVLRDLGLKAGERVAVLGLTSAPWAIADLATMSAGGISVGIYPILPISQILAILEDCAPRIIFVGSASQAIVIKENFFRLSQEPIVILWEDMKSDFLSFSHLMAQGRAQLRTQENLQTSQSQNQLKKRSQQEPTDTALLVYTSGTTGEPKGAMLSHQNCLAQVKAFVAVMPKITPKDITLSYLPMAHVAERMGLYGRIWTGLPTYFVNSLQTNVVLAAIQKVRPTLLGSVPLFFEKAYMEIQSRIAQAKPWQRSLFNWALAQGREITTAKQQNRRPSLSRRFKHALADFLVLCRVRRAFGGRVRYFLSGAAPINSKILEFFAALGLLVLEAYGLTEFGGIATVNQAEDYCFGTIGKPLPGVKLKLASDGEVLLHGPSIFQGYWKRHEATAEVLNSDGWLHTGDLAQWEPGGFLKLLGRKKNLIITSGGKNVVSSRIEEIMAVNSEVAYVIPVGEGRPYMTALVVLEEAWHSANRGNENVIRERIRSLWRAANQKLASFEQIRRCLILPRGLSMERGELTPTLKVRRQAVLEQHTQQIERLYKNQLDAEVIEIV